MKHFIFILVGACLMQGCSSQKSTLKNTSKKTTKTISNQDEEIAIFNMGLIDYSIVDPSTTTVESAKMIVKNMSSQIKFDVIYDTKSIATLKYYPDGSVRNRMLYNYEDGSIYEFIYRSGKNYYCKTGTHLKVDQSRRDSLYFEQIFRKNKSANKTIFGYLCTHFTIMDPIVNGKIRAQAFVAEDIPYINKGFGNIGSAINSLPLELTMTIQGIWMRTGALDHRKDSSLKPFLSPSFDNFIELDKESFRALTESFETNN